MQIITVTNDNNNKDTTMKSLLITVLLTTSTLTYSACTLSMDVKKEGAKTAYIKGVSVSAKIRTALSSQCDIKFKTLTKAEANQMQIDNLTTRLAKLREKAAK